MQNAKTLRSKKKYNKFCILRNIREMNPLIQVSVAFLVSLVLYTHTLIIFTEKFKGDLQYVFLKQISVMEEKPFTSL
jgi:hypothetical protein